MQSIGSPVTRAIPLCDKLPLLCQMPSIETTISKTPSSSGVLDIELKSFSEPKKAKIL